MRAWTLAFSLGLIVCGFVPQVPSLVVIICLLTLGLLLHWHNSLRMGGAFVLGCGWLLWYAHGSVSALWPEALNGKDVWTQGTVWSLPQQTERSLRFEFHIESLCTGAVLADCDFAALPASDAKVLINLYQPLPVTPGQRWQLQLRLRRPHGFANPGGFDYEAWLMQNQIRATGYVRESAGNVLLTDTGDQRQFTRLRFALVQKLAGMDGLNYPHLIRALTIGDHYGITENEWKLFSQTGTNHLIVISGMHVALIALVLYRLGWWLATRWPPLLLRWPAPQISAAFALLGAWCYAGLAGLSLPVQRAFVMAAVLFAGRLLRRQTSSVDALCLALALILALDPLAPQNAGFWLSYCAVAVLLTTAKPEGPVTPPPVQAGVVESWWLGTLHKLRLEWRTQWLVFLGLAPVMLLFFQQASPLAPLINMPAIPYIGLLVVPLALVAVLLLWIWPAAAQVLLQLTDLLLDWYIQALQWYVALTPFDLVTLPALSFFATSVLFLLVLCVLFAPAFKLRMTALLLMPLPFLWPQDLLPEGTVRVAVLDVGQGLAVVVSTRHHHLLYDTGPYFSTRFDAGSDVVVPYLRHRNIRNLDRVLVSHADNDHAGGLAGIAAVFPDAQYLGSAPDRFPETVTGTTCRTGQRWQWDGVEFEVLHPDSEAYTGNDASCVLQISIGIHSVLLPGDIERAAETKLLMAGQLRRTTLLVAPHHGSRSSSSRGFVAAVIPQVVIYASGYGNRFNHPLPDIRARYSAAGSQEYLTARSGAVEFDMSGQGLLAVREQRRERRRFWAYPL